MHGRAARALRQLVGAGAEQDEVAVAQPLEEGHGLLDLVGLAHGRRGLHGAGHPIDHREHRREVADGGLQLAERLLHGRDERLALLGRELPVELEPHHRLPAHLPARVGDAHDAPVGIALDADDRMQQQADAVPGALHGGSHGVDQERRVRDVELERRAGGRRVDDAHGHGRQTACIDEVEEAGRLPRELLELERAQPLVQGAAEQDAHEADQPLAAGGALTARDELFELAQERVRGVTFAHAAHAR